MVETGIEFVRVVIAPEGMRDFSGYLDQGLSFQTVMKAVVKDWHHDPALIDDETIEDDITSVLDMLKAQFSVVDINRMIPMSDDEHPEDIAFNAQCGFAYSEGTACNMGPGLVDVGKMYELHPVVLPLSEIRRFLEIADSRGMEAVNGLPYNQLVKAEIALTTEHEALMCGHRTFNQYPSPTSMILNGAQIRAGVEETRDDVALNVLFNPQKGYERLVQAVVSAASFG